MTVSIESELAWLSSARPELGLDQQGDVAGLLPLSEIATGSTLDRWLADTATIAADIDAKSAAAYLLSILVWRLGDIVGALYMRGTPLPPLAASDVLVRLEVTGEGCARDIDFSFRLSPRGDGKALDRAGLIQSIIDIHTPLVEALHQRTRLSARALWRLVNDGISGGMLEYGKRADCVDLAMAEASAMLAPVRSPLHNRQWRFIDIAAPGASSKWFRLRGGCCRMYRFAGNDYCPTCVVRPTENQIERLRQRTG